MKQQLQSDMPSIGTSLNDTGALTITLEDDTVRDQPEETTKQISVEQGILTLAQISIHELPRGTDGTKHDTGAFAVTLEDDTDRDQPEDRTNEITIKAGISPMAQITIHEPPRRTDSTKHDTRAFAVTLEDDTDCDQPEETTNEITIEQGIRTMAQISIHELPRGTDDTKHDTGAFAVTLEDETACDQPEDRTNEITIEQGIRTPAQITIHELPRGIEETEL